MIRHRIIILISVCIASCSANSEQEVGPSGLTFIHLNDTYRVDQEFPLFVENLKGRVFMKIYNLGNLLNDDWGRQYDAPFASIRVVDGDYDPSGNSGVGVFNYEEFNPGDPTDLQTFRSLWEIRMGIEINFR